MEDDERLRHLVGRLLDGRGYRVLKAADANEALEDLRTEHVDLLLTDVVMPGMSGIELGEALGRQSSNLKVLLMSGYADKEIAGDQINEVSTPFIAKPFRLDQLLMKVREVLEGGG